MDASPPGERSDSIHLQPTKVQADRLGVYESTHPSRTRWLTEFLRREGISEARGFLDTDLPAHEPGEETRRRKPFWTSTTIGGGFLIAIGLAGAMVYHHVSSRQHVDQAPPATIALSAPTAVQHLDHPLQTASNGAPTVLPDFPHQPVHSPPIAKSGGAAPAKAPSPELQASETFRAGGGLYLQIVYPPSDPAEASRIGALISVLRSEVGDIASATVTTGPAAQDVVVVYFFQKDHANARRIAVSLGHTTRRHYRLMLGHEHPLPRPGTVEIRLPR
jgi:hypothetical protein